MRILLNADVCGWKMSGLIGAGGAWFLGFSQRPHRKEQANYCDCKGIVGDVGMCDGACKELATMPSKNLS